MKVAVKIQARIERIPSGKVFKYSDLGLPNDEYKAAAKAISRLVKKKIVKRLSTGVFYKPKATAFGELGPSENEQLRPYLFSGKKRIAYVTGPALFNRLKLTTQVPKDIYLATTTKKPASTVGSRTVRFVKSYVSVNNKNYKLLELLDALKDFKQIPDLNTETAINRISAIILELTSEMRKDLIRYALNYPPRTRAFLGALLESNNIEQDRLLDSLKQSLNPLSSYRVGVTSDILPNSRDWFIE